MIHGNNFLGITMRLDLPEAIGDSREAKICDIQEMSITW